MALEFKENKQGNCEASLKYLQYKGPQFDRHSNGDLTKGPTELDHVPCSHPGGDAALSDQSLSSNSHEIPNKCQKKTDHKHSYSSIPAFHFNSMYQCQMNMFEGQFYPLPMDNYFQYIPFGISAQIYPNEFQRQDFQYFVVIDFEATCNKDKNPHPQEIIEFPSVIVSSATGQLEACFQTYVRPTCNQILSEFCKDLTGIQQIQVDRGITLSEALLRHDKWLEKKGIKNTDFAVVTWSNWDCKVMLESECQFKKIRKPSYFNRWINLKVPFHEVFGGLRCNLKEAVEMAGLVWQGRAHCGLDDAKNTARLLALLMQRGFKFSITNTMCQTINNPCAWKQYPDPMIVSAKSQSTQNPKDMHVPKFYYHPYCFCGVMSSKRIVDNAGPKQGCFFFGCGNWTLTRGACCHYFEWASS